VRLWVDGPQQPEGRAAAEVRRLVYEMSLNNYTTITVYGQAEQLEPPAIERLEQIQAPTFVISTDLDTSVVQTAAAIMAERIPHARHAVIRGAAHLPNLEQPEEFNRLLREFLDTVA
jgi:pimeloyl-ACP methyl ester carboxylesterase